jgi:hypothetical protein
MMMMTLFFLYVFFFYYFQSLEKVNSSSSKAVWLMEDKWRNDDDVIIILNSFLPFFLCVAFVDQLFNVSEHRKRISYICICVSCTHLIKWTNNTSREKKAKVCLTTCTLSLVHERVQVSDQLRKFSLMSA